MKLVIHNIIDLCLLAYGRLNVQMLYDVAMTVPKREKQEGYVKVRTYAHAFREAQKKINAQIATLRKSFTEEENKIMDEDKDAFEQRILEKIPDAALLRSIDQFFIEQYRNISEKTRAIIEFSLIGFLFKLLKEPVYSLFCRHDSTFTPESSLEGKIIILNLPVKKFDKVGRDCQILFKYIWQRAMERRSITENSRPVFLFCDEAQHMLHEHDADFQATARSSKIATLYISQNLPNFFASMGGSKPQFKVKSFLGTLATKIFHANADRDTNVYASELIGDAYIEDGSVSRSVGHDISQSQSLATRLERIVRPEKFVGLRTGSPRNQFLVDCYIHRQGDPFHDGKNFRKVTFSQKS